MSSYETNAILKRLRSIKSNSYPSREDSAQTVIRLRPEDLVVNRYYAVRSGDVNTSWVNVDFAEVRQAPTRIPYPHTTTDTTIADRVREMAVSGSITTPALATLARVYISPERGQRIRGIVPQGVFIDDMADCRGPDTQITDEW